MPFASSSTVPAIARRERQPKSAMVRLVGLAIASALPAIFWCVFAGLFAKALGSPLSHGTIASIFVCITAFLSVVCAPLVLRR